MPKAKPYSGPVDEELARQILNSTGFKVDVGGETLLLGDALIKTAWSLRELIRISNEKLEGNEFAKIVAEHLANKLNRRGNAEIAIAEDGHAELFISYEEHPAKRIVTSSQKRQLPLLEELRVRADEMGVDISGFGIKRKKIQEYLDGIENGTVKPKKGAKSKKRKTGPIQTANDPPESDPGPMSAGPDETRVSPAPEEPPKRGFVKTGDAVTKPVIVDSEPSEGNDVKGKKAAKPAKSKGEETAPPNLRQLVEDSKDVSIADLLTSEPPKQ